MAMQYNKSPIVLTRGRAFINGVEVMDCIKLSFKWTPKIWSGTQLNEVTPSTRWVGGSYTGEITERRTTAWLKEVVKSFIESGETPELTIQGISNDENSDYYESYGSETITLVGCVLTGDIDLLSLDSDGEVVEDSIAFNAKAMV